MRIKGLIGGGQPLGIGAEVTGQRRCAPAQVLVAIEKGTPPILAIRDYTGMSPEAFSALTGLTLDELVALETGAACCTRLPIERVAMATGVPSAALEWWLH
jgi:hypothetical protein